LLTIRTAASAPPIDLSRDCGGTYRQPVKADVAACDPLKDVGGVPI
jgi:hypothetical protein